MYIPDIKIILADRGHGLLYYADTCDGNPVTSAETIDDLFTKLLEVFHEEI